MTTPPLTGIHEGIPGTTFTGALSPRTGFSQHVLDPSDPFPRGYTPADLWGREDSPDLMQLEH